MPFLARRFDTGKLRQSIAFEIRKGGLAASLSVNVAYWAYVEFWHGGRGGGAARL